VLLLSLCIFRKLCPADGLTSSLFLILYALFRFLVEFTRQPDAQIGYVAFGVLTMGQVLSIILFLGGVLLLCLSPRSASRPRR
jgi:phosphatidylglycerol:prolipoprotein diacylglycerol transferase